MYNRIVYVKIREDKISLFKKWLKEKLKKQRERETSDSFNATLNNNVILAYSRTSVPLNSLNVLKSIPNFFIFSYFTFFMLPISVPSTLGHCSTSSGSKCIHHHSCSCLSSPHSCLAALPGEDLWKPLSITLK